VARPEKAATGQHHLTNPRKVLAVAGAFFMPGRGAMAITEQQMRSIAGVLVNKYVDVDGAAGNQCWDSATYINEVFFGLPRINTFGAGRWPGWAGNMVDAFPQSAAVAAAYELVAPDKPALPGDTLVWGDSNKEWYPKTHVATCIVDPGNGWPLCLSQNSSMARPDLPGYSADSTGPIIVQSLPKAGLIGIIRPRTAGTINVQSTPTPTQEDDLMATPEQRRELIRELLDTPINRDGGPSGVTTLRATVAWLDANLGGLPKRIWDEPVDLPGGGQTTPRTKVKFQKQEFNVNQAGIAALSAKFDALAGVVAQGSAATKEEILAQLDASVKASFDQYQPTFEKKESA
jgi:hypothetical protein